MTIARLTFYRWRSADGGAPQPDDSIEVEVGIAAFDLGDGHALWVDGSLANEDLGHRPNGEPRTWCLADVLERFRPNRIAVAYGDVYTDMATTLGIQSLAWRSADPIGDAILEVGTDCRTDDERARDIIRAREW